MDRFLALLVVVACALLGLWAVWGLVQRLIESLIIY